MGENGSASLRDSILSADDLPTEVVQTPEWVTGGVPQVTVRGLTGAERDAYEQSLTEKGPDGKLQAREDMTGIRSSLVVRCLVDDEGNRIFRDTDAHALGEKSGLVIDRLWDVARKLSGMGEQETTAAAALFGEAQSDGSSSDSASP